MDKARTLALFVSVVRAQSFRRAAMEASLTPQAVSKAVQQLEAHLGVRLLHRTTRKLSLTDEGTRLFDLAAPGLRLLDEAFDHIQHARDELDGLIRATAPTSIGTQLLMPLVRDFQQQHPGVHFDLILDDRYTDLVQARIDVGIRAGSMPERNLVARHLGDIVLKICATPDYLARHGVPAGADDLARHRCTGFRHPNVSLAIAD